MASAGKGLSWQGSPGSQQARPQTWGPAEPTAGPTLPGTVHVNNWTKDGGGNGTLGVRK